MVAACRSGGCDFRLGESAGPASACSANANRTCATACRLATATVLGSAQRQRTLAGCELAEFRTRIETLGLRPTDFHPTCGVLHIMLKPAAIVGQVILYGAFAAFIGYFATSPTYHQIPDDVALIKLSISHLGDRECRKRTPEELEKMPPNMRAPMDCPRERSDIKLEVDLDGKTSFQPPCCTPPASTRTACRPSTSASRSRPASTSWPCACTTTSLQKFPASTTSRKRRSP
jgi:hypothetical protein